MTASGESIASLKADLVNRSLAHIFSSVADSFRLVFELDGFELLDESMVGSVVKDGDLIDIKVREIFELKAAVPSLEKRKRPEIAVAEQPETEGSRLSRPAKKPKSSVLPAGSKTPPPLASIASLTSKPKPVNSPSLPSLPSSDSDSDSTSDISSSDEESSSSSSEESSSSSSLLSSSSSSGSTPSIKSSKQLANTNRQVIPQRSHTQHQLQQDLLRPVLKESPEKPHVPPGQGKQSTQERNRRRRLARQHQRAAVRAEADRGTSSAGGNQIPSNDATVVSVDEPLSSAVAPARSSASEISAPPKSMRDGGGGGELMMTSLKNSNKRKGFKDRQAGRRPERIVFEDLGPGATTTPSTPAVSRSQSRTSLPRLIPPSERTDLPHNLFVTSVDVEADLWNGGGAKSSKEKAKKGKARDADVCNGHLYPGFLPVGEGKMDLGLEGDVGKQSLPLGQGQMDLDVHLDYGEDEERQVARALSKHNPHSNSTDTTTTTTTNGRSQTAASPVEDVVDWASIERSWNELPLVVDPQTDLQPGLRVGWQALGIDAVTLTPQMILHLAQVVNLKRFGQDLGGTVTLKMYRRPGVDDFGFGLRVTHDDEGEAGVDREFHANGDLGEMEGEEDDEEVTLTLGDIREWRMVA